MDVFVSRYGHRENIWDIGCIFKCEVFCFQKWEQHSFFFSHILAHPSIFWMCDYLIIVPLAILKGSSAKWRAICIGALSLFSPSSCSFLAPAPLRAALPLLPQHKQAWSSEEWPVLTTVLLGVGLPRLGWVELAEEMVFWIPLKMGCFGGRPLCCGSRVTGASHEFIFVAWECAINRYINLTLLSNLSLSCRWGQCYFLENICPPRCTNFCCLLICLWVRITSTLSAQNESSQSAQFSIWLRIG